MFKYMWGWLLLCAIWNTCSFSKGDLLGCAELNIGIFYFTTAPCFVSVR